jgi:hypothetical protein
VPKGQDVQSNFSLLTLLFSGIYLQFSGRLFAAELLFFVAFVSMVFRGSLKKHLINSKIVSAVNLLLLALCGQIISDFYRNSDNQSFIKGFLLVFFTIINLIVISKIVDKKLNRYLVVVVLYSISSMISYLIQPQIFEDANSWKFGFGYPITAIFFAALTYKDQVKPPTILTLSLLLATADFLFGARNLAVVTVLAGLMSYISRKNQIKYSRQDRSEKFERKSQSQNTRSALRLFVMVAIVGSLVFFGYKSAVTNGLLGTDAEIKFNQQTSTNTNLLFTSRSEVFSQYVAIRNSPLVGHGSYAPLTAEIRQKLLPWLIENRVQTNLIQLESGIRYVIPVHSGIFGLWVWFGILAVPFFIYTLNLAIAVVRTKSSPPIIYYLAILICWDILFSPFGMYARIQYPISLIGMLLFRELGKGVPSEKKSDR